MIIDPEHIAISKSKGIEIDWQDGLHSSYSLAALRDNCPCAVCTGAHGTEPQRTNHSAPSSPSPFQLYAPRLRMESVEPAGNYGVRIQWSDGHGSGIYSWAVLRKLSEETSKA